MSSTSQTIHKSVLDPTKPIRVQMEALIRAKQAEITAGLETQETKKGVKFHADEWTRDTPNGKGKGGGGRSMVIQGGETFEKGGVNISIVHGELTPAALISMKANHKSFRINTKKGENGDKDDDDDELLPKRFFAAGLSMVIHPVNPHCPTTHLNYRYFEVGRRAGQGEDEDELEEPECWCIG
ncbi:unnamed protein product [Ambrosiozyma monospora]|uniref:coproporphyrinogen oxidase n=1 Tax=Ambrosiozyma monospora TaxID=43982 RepID=A0A9W6YVH6_AMBMO|nr:unnamed protein product [Ambrosiozyma monospora]